MSGRRASKYFESKVVVYAMDARSRSSTFMSRATSICSRPCQDGRSFFEMHAVT